MSTSSTSSAAFTVIPRSFTVERLLAIFRSVSNLKLSEQFYDVELYTQVPL